jgi:hypothetical protein
VEGIVDSIEVSHCGFRSIVPVTVDPTYGSPLSWPGNDSNSYKQMCWFWSYGILYNPVFLKYRWRLDSDSRILQPLAQEPVTELIWTKHRPVIGYSYFTFEYFSENEGLSDLVEAATLFYQPKYRGFSMPLKRGIPILYSNFLVFDREHVTRKDTVRKFLLAVHRGVV